MTVLPNTKADVAGLPRLPNGLALLGAVNALEAGTLSFATVQDRDGVAIADVHHAAGELLNDGWLCLLRLTGRLAEALQALQHLRLRREHPTIEPASMAVVAAVQALVVAAIFVEAAAVGPEW